MISEYFFVGKGKAANDHRYLAEYKVEYGEESSKREDIGFVFKWEWECSDVEESTVGKSKEFKVDN